MNPDINIQLQRDKLANVWRTGVGRVHLTSIERVLAKQPFDKRMAVELWDKAQESWSKKSGLDALDPGWHAQRWSAKATSCDSGQANNKHCGGIGTLRHPLLSACRFGSEASIAWVCSKPGIDPVVGYADVADFWSFDRSAVVGISGAFGALWELAIKNKWTHKCLGEALSTWLVGAACGQSEDIKDSLKAAQEGLDYLVKSDPGFVIPMAPMSVFSSALSASMFQERQHDEGQESDVCITEELIKFAPESRWIHEANVPDTESYEAQQANPAMARTFVEDALQLGNGDVMRLLMNAGYEMPSVKRAWELLEGAPPSQLHWRAYEVVRSHAACAEADELRGCAKELDVGVEHKATKPRRAL